MQYSAHVHSPELVAFCSLIALLDTQIPMSISVYCFLTKEWPSRILYNI